MLIKSIKKLLIHLFIILTLITTIIFGTFYFLGKYTLHRKSIELPNFVGKNLKEVIIKIKKLNLNYSIIDSIYYPEKKKKIVLKQEPEAGERVKKNRTIYIKTTKVLAPKIKLPSVVDMSERLAIARLKSYGINIKITYIPAICKGCVIKQLYKGKEMYEGQELSKNEEIELILGLGVNDEKVAIPNLLGLSRKKAIKIIKKSFLNEGISDCIDCFTNEDTLSAFVYRQIPNYDSTKNTLIRVGSSIDFWTTTDSVEYQYFFQNNLLNKEVNSIPKP